MIGLINIQWFDNPGAVWLAYSLQQTVRKLKPDEEVVIIDYAAGGSKTIDLSPANKVIKRIKRKVSNALFYLDAKNRKFGLELKERHGRYEEFRKEYLNRTPRTTKTNSEIFKKDYSACVVGSDVVWKPEIAEEEHSKIYFLQFAGDNTKKIAYAASIGTDDMVVLDRLKPLYRSLIADFNSISLREKTAVQYIGKLTDKKVSHVLDPVFLSDADAYVRLIKDVNIPCQQKYIYLYMLSYNEDIVTLALQLAQRNGYKIVYDLHTKENLVLKKEFKEYGVPSTAVGPLEFLALINSASVILCDSFHGTAFSIILHKDFYTFGNHNGGIDISARMKDLLEILALEKRYVTDNSTISSEPIDYADVDKKLDNYRKESIEFLKKSLESFW